MKMLLQGVIAFLSGGIGQRVGNGVANVTAVALLAALAPLGYWAMENRDQVLIDVTVGDLIVLCLVGVFLVKLLQYTRPPGPIEPAPWYRHHGGGPGE